MSPVPPRLAALLLAAAAAAHAQPAAPGWRLSLASDRHVDALALGRLGDDEAARALDPRAGRNLGYLFDELRLERRGSDGTRVVLLARQRAIAIASAGALELARQVETGGTPGHDRDWRVDLDHLGFAGAGLELGTRDLVPAPGVTLALSAQALALQRVGARQIDGRAGWRQAEGRYQAELRSLQIDDRLDFPFRQPMAARGWALLLGGRLALRDGAWDGELRWQDAGRLHWRGLPQQQAQLSTDQAGLDADGFVSYRPLVEGRNRQPPWRRTLAPVSTLEIGWRGEGLGRLQAGLVWLPGWGALPRLGWQGQAGGWGLSAQWRPHERRIGVGIERSGWSLQLGSDLRGGERRSMLLQVSGPLPSL